MTIHRDLQLPELLEFRRDEGEIRMHDQRVVILSATALSLLRRELVGSLGRDGARRSLMRFGYADGYHDAVAGREHLNWQEPLDGLVLGPVLHSLQGIVLADLVRLEYEPHARRFEAHAVCHHSFEAEQHLQMAGTSDVPVCWSLVGYASGYASACTGLEIYFQETACAAAHGADCIIVGRDAASWGGDASRLRAEFSAAGIAADVGLLTRAASASRVAAERRLRGRSVRSGDLGLLHKTVTDYAQAHDIVLVSQPLRTALELAARVAPLDMTVLVSGESGTGKEAVVRMIHEQSPRVRGPLVCVNCAAMPEPLLESELFGHVRGAFTDAVRDKAGLFEVAKDGSLFLDEVGEMPLSLQAKLLRALQDGEIRRVGGEKTIRVTPRIIAATNRDLRAEVQAGAFREDLYFRLAAFVITVPPLRERREAIPAIAQALLGRLASRSGKPELAISPDAMTRLIDYAWPGNVRELQHVIERAVVLASGPRITREDLPAELGPPVGGAAPAGSFDLTLREQEAITQALARFNGNRRQTAEALHISRATLWRKIKRYGMTAADDGDGDR
jgi:DNA-binding NtrC family response regulator